MPAPRASRLATRKSITTNLPDFLVPSSPELPPIASTSTEPILRRSNRLSLDNSISNELPLPIITKKSTKSTKDKVSKELNGRASKRRRSGGVGEADDEAFEEEDSIAELDATKATKRKLRGSTSVIAPIQLPSKSISTKSRGVVPRAAKAVKKAPPVFSNRLQSGDFTEDSDGGFEFSTHPPTPGAALQSNKKGKRNADILSESRPGKTSRRVVQPPISPPPRHPQSTPGKISTRESDIPHRYDPNTDGMVGLNLAETPIGIKNLVMRNGTGSNGKSNSRRESLDKRGKRGSSIGDGFSILPHDYVPSNELYKSTQLSAPPAIRLRSIISWTSQRQKDKTFPETNGSNSESSNRVSRSIKKGPTEVEKRFGKGIVEEFIKGICGKVIDVSWKDATDDEPKNKKKLPPHPQNVFDDEQYSNLMADLADINKEELEREKVSRKLIDIHQSHKETIASTSKLKSFDPSTINFDAEIPELKDLEQILQFGEDLINGSTSASPTTPNAKGKGRGRPKAIKAVADTLEEDLKMVFLQSANFNRLTYRLSQFTLQSSTYLENRVSKTHQFLKEESKSGINNLVASEIYERKRGGVGLISEVVNVSNSSGGAEGTTSRNGERGKFDSRDLLRAIAFADGIKR